MAIRLHSTSIEKKIRWIILLISVVVLLVTTSAFVVYEIVSFKQNIKQELVALAGVLSYNTRAAIMFDNQKDVREVLSGLQANPRVLAVQIYREDGTLFCKYVAPGAKPSGASKGRAIEAPLYFSLASIVISRPIMMNEYPVGTIRIEADMQQLQKQFGFFLTIVLTVLTISLIVAVVLSHRLQHFITKPILGLVKAMQRVSREKNYSIRSEKTSQDEIGDLVDNFNEMLAEIESRDVTLQQRQEHLRELANFDNLTHLPNRALYCDRLQQAIHQSGRIQSKIAILFIDLDHFKDINDTLGHRIGDLLLISAAQRLKSTIRVSDTVGRLGGDEFTIMLPDIKNAQSPMVVSSKILKCLAAPFQIEEHEIHISGSIGIAIFPDDGQTVEELLKNADTAMYEAKKNGKNTFQLYAEEMTSKTQSRIAMMGDLHHVIDRHELVLFYQPKIAIPNFHLTGFEALLRWNHHHLGIISPDLFIPLAEETGLIVAIGEWVMRDVCRQLKDWQAKGYPAAPIAVNVSPIQLRHNQFVETLRAILDETQVAPSLIEIELTESAIMQNVETTASILKEIKAMGIRVSVDDFGTGYSSLSQLKRFPIDTLKIDKSFVLNINRNKEDEAIVTAIISMARSLGMDVVAEGVETPEQMQILALKGCHQMQGYLFSKPLPSKSIESFMRTIQDPDEGPFRRFDPVTLGLPADVYSC